MSSPIKQVHTDRAPSVDLPLSQAIIHGDTVYLSGQVPVDPEDPGTVENPNVVGENIEEQTEAVMENAKAILEAAGSSLDNLIKATVYLTDTDDFGDFNKTYRSYLSEPYPARSAFEVSKLAADFKVEVEFIASV